MGFLGWERYSLLFHCDFTLAGREFSDALCITIYESSQVIYGPMMLSKSQRKRLKKKVEKKEVRAIESRALVPIVQKALVAPKAVAAPRAKQARRPKGAAVGNTYLATLQDPWRVRGVKVPDEVCVPTGTWSFEIQTAHTTSAGGELVAMFNPRLLGNSTNAAVANAAYVFCGNAAYTTYSALANPTIHSVVGRLRPVSAAMKAYSTSSPLNISGVACSFVIPCGTEDSNSNLPTLTTFGGFASMPYNTVNHAAEGASVRWAISDPSELEFEECTINATSVGWTYTAGVLTGQGNGSAIGVIFTGLPASSTVRVSVVANYEFIPSLDTQQFVSAEPSPQNRSWMEQAARYFGSNHQAFFDAGRFVSGMTLPYLNQLATGGYGSILGSAFKGVSGLLM